MSEDKIKVLTCKLGLDVHNRGITIVNRALRDAGMEVIFIGNQFPRGVVEAAVQEDVDVIACGNLSSTYMEYAAELTQLVKEKEITDKLLILGGIVLPEDMDPIKELGVDEVFPPGSPVTKIVEYIRENAKRHAAA
jgi:methylmalonyl-CoA mutase C-terminal domain/subunit